MDGFTGGDVQPTVIEVTGAHAIEVPGGAFIAGAEFVRDNLDLYLIGEDGQTILLENYFNHATPPDLVSEDGARLSAALVKTFVPPVHSGEFAEAGTVTSDATIQPAGVVTEVNGKVTVQHADGTVSDVHKGDPIYEGDVITTDAKGAVNIEFADKTTFAISNDARFAVNDFNYDADAVEGNSFFSMLRGVFVYTSGLIGKDDPGHVHIETPVGSIGIRGTVVAGHIQPAGEESKISIIEGEAFIDNGTGQQFTLNDRLETAVFKGYGSQPVSFGISDVQTLQAEYKGVEHVAPALYSAIETGVNPNEYLKELIKQIKPEHGDNNGDQQQPSGSEKSGAADGVQHQQQAATQQQGAQHPAQPAHDAAHTGSDAPVPPPPPSPLTAGDDHALGGQTDALAPLSGGLQPTGGLFQPPPPPPPTSTNTGSTIFNPPPPPPPSGTDGGTTGGTTGGTGGTTNPPPNPPPVFDGSQTTTFGLQAHSLANAAIEKVLASDPNNTIIYSIDSVKLGGTVVPNPFAIDSSGNLKVMAGLMSPETFRAGTTYQVDVRITEGGGTQTNHKIFSVTIGSNPDAHFIDGINGDDNLSSAGSGAITGAGGAKYFFGYEGNDKIVIASGTGHQIFGGSGDDSIYMSATAGGNLQFRGGTGADSFYISKDVDGFYDGGTGAPNEVDTVYLGFGVATPVGLGTPTALVTDNTGGPFGQAGFDIRNSDGTLRMNNIEKIVMDPTQYAPGELTLSVADVVGVTDNRNILRIGGAGTLHTDLSGSGFSYYSDDDTNLTTANTGIDGSGVGVDIYRADIGGGKYAYLIIDNAASVDVQP